MPLIKAFLLLAFRIFNFGQLTSGGKQEVLRGEPVGKAGWTDYGGFDGYGTEGCGTGQKRFVLTPWKFISWREVVGKWARVGKELRGGEVGWEF